MELPSYTGTYHSKL